MQKLQLALVLCLFAGFMLSSCTPLYLPNTANTPLFTSKGEFQASVHSGTAGLDPQLAYALTDNIGLMINASFPIGDEADHKHPYIEMGTGYFRKIGDHGVFEVYGGFGYRSLTTMGVIEYYTEEEQLDYSAELLYSTRAFIQPAVGAKSDILDVSFAPRFVLVNIIDDRDRQNEIFFEPAITAKVGYKSLRIVLQAGSSTSFDKEIQFDYQPLFFSVGIQAKLDRIYN